MNKLGFTEEEVGEMPIEKFYRLYDAYKAVHDSEQNMFLNALAGSESGIGYCTAEKEATIMDII